MLKTILILSGPLLMVLSCASMRHGNRLPARLSADEYLSWHASDRYPFRDTVKADDITYICTYGPREVEISRQLSAGLLSVQDARELLKEPENQVYFQLQILLPQAGTDVLHYKLRENESSTSRTSYFSFDMKSDLHISSTGSDSLTCNTLHFERGIPYMPVARIQAGFPAGDPNIRSVTYRDRIFSGMPVTFLFNKLKTTDLPQLKL